MSFEYSLNTYDSHKTQIWCPACPNRTLVRSAHSSTATHDVHSNLIGHHPEVWQIQPLDFLPYLPHSAFDNILDLSSADPPRVCPSSRVPAGGPAHEGHLHVYLREFRLTIFPPVFISETSGELVVSVDSAGCHEKLFRLLW